MKPTRALTITLLLLLCLAGTVLPQNRLARSVFGSGGIPVSDGSHGISSTLGQPCTARTGDGLRQGRFGFWYTVAAGPVGVEGPGALPTSSLAIESYPNPFTNETTLRVSLPRRSTVTIEIFDVLGRRLAAIDAGNRDAGLFDVHLDRSSLPAHSGGVRLYYCRLTARERSVIHAMLRRE